MYAITGITGKVGSELARTLLAAGKPVRAIVRDAGRGRAWVAQGCELALANMNDRAALTSAFTGVPRQCGVGRGVGMRDGAHP